MKVYCLQQYTKPELPPQPNLTQSIISSRWLLLYNLPSYQDRFFTAPSTPQHHILIFIHLSLPIAFHTPGVPSMPK